MLRALTVLSLLCLSNFALADVPTPAPLATGDPTLVRTMSALLEKPALRGAKLGLLVAPLGEGPPVFALNTDELLHPASNTKLFTVAAALDRLGPAYQWTTDLVAGELKDGEADRLYLIGGGDPRLVIEQLWEMVETARYEAGLTRVKGDLVVDDAFFTPDRLAPGFAEKSTDSAYRAATDAVSLNFNTLQIYVRPAAEVGQPPVVTVRPDVGYADVVVEATTVAKGKPRISVSARPAGERTRITVSGRLPLDHAGISTRRRLDNPPLFTALVLRDLLRRAKIELGGEIKFEKAPDKRVLLARRESASLASVIADVNKLSNNFMAETVLRTLGAVKRGRGGWAEGVAEVRDFLETEVGLAGFRYANGSGLFADTAFSAAQTVKLLRYMAQRRPALPEFAASLAIAGADGTLQNRQREVEAGVIRAKTGTLDGVICLSGYTYFADGSPAVFSFLMNDLKAAAWDVWQIQDALLEAIQKHTPEHDARAAR